MNVTVLIVDEARRLIRFRTDGKPAPGQEAWIRVFGQCVVREYGCWEYTRPLSQDGYGSIRVAGRADKVHRVAWAYANERPVPDGMDVCHRCDNPPCCNPKDLFLGTHAENNIDRHAKGRTVMPTNGPDYQRAKIRCPWNHDYTGDNVRFRKSGARYCAECSRLRAAEYLARNRDQVNARKRERRAAARSIR